MSLKDIAIAANVSVSTVSRVLSNSSSSAASPQVKERILAIAREQDYVPNQHAKQLRTGAKTSSPKSLYCLYACRPDETKDDPFFSKLLEHIEYKALKENYIVKYIFSGRALEDPGVINHFSKNPQDFLIILGRFDKALYQKLAKNFKKIVYIGLNELDVPCDQIICSGYEMSRECVNYLTELGHKKIGYIGANEGRFKGYLQGMKDNNLNPDPSYYDNSVILSMDDGYIKMKALVNSNTKITAVVCGNDMVAIGALRACKDCKIKVPEDMSIIGINNIENIQFTNPMLSSVNVPLEEMGSMGVNILIDKILGNHTSNIKVFFPFSIVKRESCAYLK